MNKLICHVVLLVLTCSSILCQEWELFWSDEFDGDSIDLTKWDYEITAWGGGNSEFQVYTDDPRNSYVSNGVLYIQPTLLEENINPLTGEPFGQDFLYSGTLNLTELYGRCTNPENDGCVRQGYAPPQDTEIPPIASGRIRSSERFSYRYGRAEVRAKMPVGDWMWPAVWFLPENWCYGDWPVSGEYDLVESVGNEDFYYADGRAAGVQRAGSAMHWGVGRPENRFNLTIGEIINETVHYGETFHIYEVIWSPAGYSYLVDGVNILNVPDPLIPDNEEWEGFFEFGKPWTTINESDPEQNPWRINNNPDLAPFDSEFHILMNVAIGGTNDYIPDEPINRGGDPAYAKPWLNGMTQNEAMNLFYNARGEDETSGWLWTWLKERENNVNDAMQVDYVRIYKRDDLPPEQEVDCPQEA